MQALPASTRSFVTVLIETPVMRVVDRREFPSTRAEMIATRLAVLSLFMPPTILDRSSIFNRMFSLLPSGFHLENVARGDHNKG